MSVEKSLTFFKVFDLAFFAPGAVLFTAVYVYGFVPIPGFNKEVTNVAGIVALLLTLASIFIAGLLVHGVVFGLVRPLLQRKAKRRQGEGWRSLPQKLAAYEGDAQARELVLYFWYLRATCWNLALALVASAALVAVKIARVYWAPYPWGYIRATGLVIAALAVAALLIKMGLDFQRQVKKTLGEPEAS